MADRVTLLAALVLAPNLLAGCIDALFVAGPPMVDGTWTKHSCDPGAADALSSNAPYYGGWLGGARKVASNYAKAFGRALPDDERPRGDGSIWWVGDGIRVGHSPTEPDDRFPPLNLEFATAQRILPTETKGAEHVMRRVLEQMDVDENAVVRFEHFPGQDAVRFRQFWNGDELEWTGGLVPTDSQWAGESGWSVVGTYPLHDLEKVRVRLGSEEAVEIARRYHRCAMDDEGRTAAAGFTQTRADHIGFEVDRYTLVHEIQVRYSEPPPGSHCGFSAIVHIDTGTGLVVGEAASLCA